jgi:Flp pilus assembly protein TadG
MRAALHARLKILVRRLRTDEAASQLVEFAVSLPLLVVFVVGIFDFSGAFTLKQKLANAAREGARAAAADPANDLGNSTPASVTDALWVVDNYLTSEKINDCGVTTAKKNQSQLTWSYSANANGCPGNGLRISINRACVTKTVSGPVVNIVGTCVSIRYAYQWRFNSVITLLVPATYQGVTDLTVSAGSLNEN